MPPPATKTTRTAEYLVKDVQLFSHRASRRCVRGSFNSRCAGHEDFCSSGSAEDCYTRYESCSGKQDEDDPCGWAVQLIQEDDGDGEDCYYQPHDGDPCGSFDLGRGEDEDAVVVAGPEVRVLFSFTHCVNRTEVAGQSGSREGSLYFENMVENEHTSPNH